MQMNEERMYRINRFGLRAAQFGVCLVALLVLASLFVK